MLKTKLLIILLLGCLVFRLKYMVNHTSLEVKELNFRIAQSREDLDILTAEYAYLERPERLLQEAERLGFKPMKSNQILLLEPYLNRFDNNSIGDSTNNKRSEQSTMGPR